MSRFRCAHSVRCTPLQWNPPLQVYKAWSKGLPPAWLLGWLITLSQVLLCCCAKWGACSFSLSKLACFLRDFSWLLSILSAVLSVEAPYILQALPNQTVFKILAHWHNRPCYFIPDITDYFLTGSDQPQTNQP